MGRTKQMKRTNSKNLSKTQQPRPLTTFEKKGTKVRHDKVGTIGIIVGSYAPSALTSPHGGFKIYVAKEDRTFGLPFEKIDEWSVVSERNHAY